MKSEDSHDFFPSKTLHGQSRFTGLDIKQSVSAFTLVTSEASQYFTFQRLIPVEQLVLGNYHLLYRYQSLKMKLNQSFNRVREGG